MPVIRAAVFQLPARSDDWAGSDTFADRRCSQELNRRMEEMETLNATCEFLFLIIQIMEENAMKNLKSLMFYLIVILVLSVSLGFSPAPRLSYASSPINNAWTYTGDLSDAHWKGTATLLQDGKVLVVGGIGLSGVTASAELYDPATGTWSTTGAMNTAREHHTATLLPDGRVLVAGGGYPNGQVFSSAELYDPTTGTWSTTSAMNTAREVHTATLLPNGKVLVVGGSSSTSTELYDPATSTWGYTGSLNFSRGCHSATVLTNGKVLVAGGYHNDVGNASAELYDPATGTWSLTGSMNEPRSWPTATLLPDGKVLVAGSEIFWNIISSAEIYNPAIGTWSYTGSMHDARGNHMAVSLPDGTVLVAGGLATNDRSAEIFDPAAGTWSYTASMNDGRRWPNGTFLPDGKVLVTGGEGITTTEVYNFPPSVYLVPPEQTLQAERGDTLKFVETLSNYTGITDTFNLELSDSLWPAMLSDTTIGPLGHGEQITFTVDVAIPLDADWGVLNTVTITATSSVSPTVFFDTALLNSQMAPLINTTTMILSDAPDPSQAGKPFTVTFGVTSTLGIPTGVVTVTVSDSVETCSAELVDGLGSCQIALSTPGTYTLNANYTGEENFLPSSTSELHTVDLRRIHLPLLVKNHYLCSDFFDDFSDPSSGWYIGEDSEGRAEYLNGEYSVLLKPADYFWVLGAPTCDQVNYSVEVEARWAGDSGASYGLIFGIQGDYEQFYSFDVNTDYQDFALYLYGPGGWTEIAPVTYSSAIHPGAETNHLKATRSGDAITLEVNGTVLGTWTDSTISGESGSGLIVSTYSDAEDGEASFDNFALTGLGSTASALEVGFESQQLPLPRYKANEGLAHQGLYRQRSRRY